MTVTRQQRRAAFRVFGLAIAIPALGALAACSNAESTIGTAAGSSAVQQVLADIQAGLTTVANVVTGAASYLGAATVTAIQGYVTAAQNGLASLLASVGAVGTATGAGVVGKIGGYLQSAVDAVVATLSGVAGASSWLTLAQTVAALLPGVFAFVSSIVPTVAVTASAVLPAISVNAARARLGVPVLATK